MSYKLRVNARYFSDKDLLDDLRRVARLLKKESITQKDYRENGKFGFKTFFRRFGSWNESLKKAGLNVKRKMNISDEDLFENLEKIWKKLGRQPFYSEIRKPLSKYCVDVYCRRFGSWIKSCESFIKYKENKLEFSNHNKTKSTGRSRTINERTRLKVFKRDGYKCVVCGRSPATHVGIFLHVDHILPFSKGGSNKLENLRTLCQKCNLGKGDDSEL